MLESQKRWRLVVITKDGHRFEYSKHPSKRAAARAWDKYEDTQQNRYGLDIETRTDDGRWVSDFVSDTTSPDEIAAQPKCRACKVDEARARGEQVSRDDLNHWSLRGCTCSPQAAADAIAYMDRVTR